MFIEMPKKCPITGGMATGIKIDCPGCAFYIDQEKQCRIIPTDNNIRLLLALLQKQQQR